MQSETITLLRAKRGRACKTITPYGTRSYDHIKHWSYGSATVASLADFATLLTKLETDEETIIIRGRPRHRLAAAEIVLRRKAMFESQPLRLVCFDIDQLEAPEGVSPISEAAIEHVIRLLPSAFHTANYVAQFSASAGLTARAVKVHLWFMLRTPAEDDALRAWARSTGVVDPALFNAIQPHYVANPRFEEGALDPFDGGSRVHYMRKQHECVDWAPPPVTAAVRPAGGECVASEIVTDDGGKAIDGRETRLRNIRWRVLNDAKRPRTLEEFTARVWQEFCERAVLGPTAKSSHSWDFDRVADACRSDWEKHGKVIVTPENATVFVEEAEALIRKAVRDVIAGAQIALKVTVGAGKSTIAAQELAGKNVEIYAPTNAQQQEWAERTGGTTILGRNAKTCLRHAEVKELQRMGIPADAALCKGTLGGAGKCVHFESCPYQAQFRATGPRTRIYSHAHLTTPRHKSFAPPDIAVIDEGFLSSAIETTDFNLSDLHTVAARVSDNWEHRAAVEAIIAVVRALESPDAMLDRLRQGGVSAEALRDAAKIVSKVTPRLALRAGESAETLKKRVMARRRASFVLVTRLFRALARELETGRRGAHCVMRMDEGFHFCQRLPLKRLEGVKKILLLDADLERENVLPFFPDLEFREIEVRQNLHVTQISDLSFSRTWLGFSEAGVDEEKIAELCERVRPLLGERPLIVTYKGLDDHLRERLPAKCRFEHFGNTRGTNAYKDCDAVVVIGRQFWSTAKIEAQARALHYDAAEPLSFETIRRWHAAGSESALPSIDFIDPRVQALMEAHREAETRQAVGRGRAVRSPTMKKAYLFSNQPVRGLKPDRLVKYERSKAEAIYSHLGGWLPLNPKLLVRFAGGYFPGGERQALKWRDKFQDPQALCISIERGGLETGTPILTHGRERGTRGARKFKIWIDPLIHCYPERSLAGKADLIVDPLPWARPRRGTPPFELPLGFEVMCLPDRRPSWVRRLGMARQSRLAIDWYEPLHARSQWYWNPPLVWRPPSPDFRICEPQERSYDAAA